MAKSSSASSGTRKKQAAKKAAKQVDAAGEAPSSPSPSMPSHLTKKEKQALKVKRGVPKPYTPPPKPPAPAMPDPLDALGLAATLPPDLVVVLRKLGKKDEVTRRRAVEDFAGWLARVGQNAEPDGAESDDGWWIEMIGPVWLHHLPSLLLTARLTSITLQTHATILASYPTLLTATLPYLVEHQQTSVLGSLLVSSLQNRIPVDSFLAEPDNLPQFASYLSMSILSPGELWRSIFPIVVGVDKEKKTGYRGRIEAVGRVIDDSMTEEQEREEAEKQEREVGIRIGGLQGLSWLLKVRSEPSPPTEESEETATAPLAPEDLTSLLSNSALWSCLSTSSPEALGFSQPAIRKAAWDVLRSVVQNWPTTSRANLQQLSIVVLGSCWVERDQGTLTAMWEPLLIFLTKYPEAWTLATENDISEGEPNAEDDGADEEEDEKESTDQDDEQPQKVSPLGSQPPASSSTAYLAFLDFLRSGCGGYPLQGYPVLVVVLSTIPSSILPLTNAALEIFFTAFWAAFPSLLSSTFTPSPTLPFLATLLECNTYLLAKRSKQDSNPVGARNLVIEQVSRVWEAIVEIGAANIAASAGTSRRRRFVGRPRPAGEEGEGGLDEARYLGKSLEKLLSVDEIAGSESWSSIVSGTINLLTTPNLSGLAKAPLPLSKLVPLLAALRSTLPEALIDSFQSMVAMVSRLTIGSVMQNIDEDDPEAEPQVLIERIGFVTELVASEPFAVVLREDDIFYNVFDSLLKNETFNVLRLLPPTSSSRLFHLSFSWREDKDASKERFAALSQALSSSSNLDHALRLSIIKALLSNEQLLPEWLASSERQEAPLDSTFGSLADSVLGGQGGAEEAEVLEALLAKPEPFVSQRRATAVVERMLESLSSDVAAFLVSGSSASAEHLDSNALNLPILQAYFANRLFPLETEIGRKAASALFDAAFLVPHASLESDEVAETAASVFASIRNGLSSEAAASLSQTIVSSLKEKLANTTAQLSPQDLAAAIEASSASGGRAIIGIDVSPSSSALNSDLAAICAHPTPPVLAVLDPLVPQVLSEEDGELPPADCEHDAYGLSSFARLATFAILVLSEDRASLRKEPSWLRIISTLGIFAEDRLAFPEASGQVFGSPTTRAQLEEIVRSTDSLRSYALSALAAELDSSWHTATLAALAKPETASSMADGGLGALVADLVQASSSGEDIYASRVLRDLLRGILLYSSASAEDCEKWLMYARTQQTKAPQVALAIIYASKDACLDSPRLDRFQNEVAAELTGLKASAVNTKGLPALRLLAAAAPPPDSTAIFLPQRRTVMLMQTLQAWMTSDEEDLSEELDSRVAEMFLHLTPIAQNDLGSHWEFVFDLLEANLDAASWKDPSTLPFLAHTLRLLIVVRDLAASNKILRELWDQRKKDSLDLVFGLFLTESGGSTSLPLSICRGMVLELVDDLPLSTLTPERLPQLCALLHEQSVDVQVTAQTQLQRMIKARTSDLVVQVEVDSDAKVDIKLPQELIDVIASSLEATRTNSEEDVHMSISTYLLAWKLVFDYFEDASLRIKTSYIEQLRASSLVSSAFLPSIFAILDVAETGTRPFDLGPWAVDELIIEMYDPEEPTALALLAAHLYYRALINIPSIVRSWWLECKDRQLSLSVSSFTSKHFSPVIINHELSTLRDPDALSALQDESLTVKILPAVNEVTASYVVDEQPMEIAVRLPADYPLHGVEVKDLRRVGVPESKWRAWLLAVQQVVTSKDGLVLDALTLFKRNVSLHFAGVVDCAICYSIISVSDRSLPNRSCKTCSNKFHASCLYKWFATSNSSSCPLCRSLF